MLCWWPNSCFVHPRQTLYQLRYLHVTGCYSARIQVRGQVLEVGSLLSWVGDQTQILRLSGQAVFTCWTISLALLITFLIPSMKSTHRVWNLSEADVTDPTQLPTVLAVWIGLPFLRGGLRSILLVMDGPMTGQKEDPMVCKVEVIAVYVVSTGNCQGSWRYPKEGSIDVPVAHPS